MRNFSKSYTIDNGRGGTVTLVTSPQTSEHEFVGADAVFDGERIDRAHAAARLYLAHYFKRVRSIEVGGLDYCEECGGPLAFPDGGSCLGRCDDVDLEVEREEEAAHGAR